MRLFLTIMLSSFAVFVSGCSDDGTSGGGAFISADSVNGDTALGDDSADGDGYAYVGGCMCQNGYKCVAGPKGYDCVLDPDASSDTSSNLTCTQVGQCVEDSCSTGAQPCGLTCASGASTEVAGKLNDLSSCVAQKCQNGLCKGAITTKCMNDCTGSQCGTLLLDCFEDNTPGGNACASALSCFDGCDKNSATSGHFTCMSKCYTGLTTAAKGQLKAFTDCLAKGPGGNAGLAACQTEYTACATGGVSGTGSCADISKCIANCPASDGACPANCLAVGSAQAQTQINAMNTCFGNTTDQTTCLGQLETCAAPAGTGKCTGIQTCTDACKKGFAGGDDKGSCTIGCLHEASQPAADAFIAFFKCVIPNCPECTKGDATCNTCLQNKCNPQLKACTST